MVPKTGMSSVGVVHASLLRCTCLATSRKASLAPLRSNLLMATNSAKSSMSIFSSWLAAPNSGVITYIGMSTCGTMAASPWPMPDVSTMIKSKPAHFVAANTSGKAALISLPKSRVAKLRMKTRWPESFLSLAVFLPALQGDIAFMRMRSPSKAPPLLRREGSIDITAIRSSSPWSKRIRRTSSSVNEDLPAPPVPVMPKTGTLWLSASLRTASTNLLKAGSAALPLDVTCAFSNAVMSCANLRHAISSRPWMSLTDAGA